MAEIKLSNGTKVAVQIVAGPVLAYCLNCAANYNHTKYHDDTHYHFWCTECNKHSHSENK